MKYLPVCGIITVYAAEGEELSFRAAVQKEGKVIMGRKKSKAQKKAALIQGMMGIVCLGMLGFVFVWAVHNAVKGFDNDSTIIADTSVSASDSSEADSKSSDDPANDTSASDDTSADSKEDSAADSVQETSSSEESSEDASSKEDSQIREIEFPTADDIKDDFDDAVFIGNSRTVGLGMNCGKPMATFYASTGLNVETISKSETITLDNGKKGTVYDALKQKKFKRVFIMFGINEMSWPYWDGFESRYETVIDKVKELQPEARIYVQSVLPVNSLALNNNSVFTPAKVDEINTYVKKAADAKGAVYLDVNSAIRLDDGSLPMDAAPTDGIHLVKKYCLVWLKYLADNT